MASIQKPMINAIQSVAFLLDKLEETQINTTVKEAIDHQTNELASNMKLLIEDIKEKLTNHIKTTKDHISKIITMTITPLTQQQPSSTPTPTTTATTTTSTTTTTYASALINPPPHANPKITAKEGIKARQFLNEGTKNSRLTNLNALQTKSELNKIITDLGIHKGKI